MERSEAGKLLMSAVPGVLYVPAPETRVECPVCTYFDDSHGYVWVSSDRGLCVSENVTRVGWTGRTFYWSDAWFDTWLNTLGGSPIAYVACPVCDGVGKVMPAVVVAYQLVFGDDKAPNYQEVARMRESFER